MQDWQTVIRQLKHELRPSSLLSEIWHIANTNSISVKFSNGKSCLTISDFLFWLSYSILMNIRYQTYNHKVLLHFHIRCCSSIQQHWVLMSKWNMTWSVADRSGKHNNASMTLVLANYQDCQQAAPTCYNFRISWVLCEFVCVCFVIICHVLNSG